jgi:hypothetical protein
MLQIWNVFAFNLFWGACYDKVVMVFFRVLQTTYGAGSQNGTLPLPPTFSQYSDNIIGRSMVFSAIEVKLNKENTAARAPGAVSLGKLDK